MTGGFSLPVIYSPQDSGTNHTNSYTFAFDDGTHDHPNGTTVVLNLSGSGTAPTVITSNNSVNFGAFRLAGLLDWNKGGTVRNNQDAYFAFGHDLWGDSARSASFVSQTIANLTPREQPASYLKLRSLSLTYTVPAKWVSRVGGGFISSARLGLTGRNLLQWWGKGYDGLDPEGSSFGSQNVIRGDQITPYPPARSYFLSLDLGL